MIRRIPARLAASVWTTVSAVAEGVAAAIAIGWTVLYGVLLAGVQTKTGSAVDGSTLSVLLVLAAVAVLLTAVTVGLALRWPLAYLIVVVLGVVSVVALVLLATGTAPAATALPAGLTVLAGAAAVLAIRTEFTAGVGEPEAGEVAGAGADAQPEATPETETGTVSGSEPTAETETHTDSATDSEPDSDTKPTL